MSCSQVLLIECSSADDGARRPQVVEKRSGAGKVRVVDGSGAEVATGETGELVVRGPNVMTGYWRRPAEPAEVLSDDGWLRTGDLACCGEDGRYEIVGRAKELIISEGYNVYPREVERALTAHPAVREAVALGVAHAILGEEIVACVVLHTGAEATSEELIAFMARRLAKYKLPRRLWFADELPRTATGKVVKHRIVVPESTSPLPESHAWV
jgi:long-chain acyl-CoA synthetase